MRDGTPIHRYSLENPAAAATTGDVTAMALYAGQSAGPGAPGSVRRPDIIDGMVDDAAAILKRLGSG